jgi:hypothetical protein
MKNFSREVEDGKGGKRSSKKLIRLRGWFSSDFPFLF